MTICRCCGPGSRPTGEVSRPDIDVAAIDYERVLQYPQDLLCRLRPTLQVRPTGREHGELVSAKARHRVRLPKRRGQAQRDLLQEEIANLVAEGIVDLLEAVHVHDEQHQGFSFPMSDHDGLAKRS